MRAGSAETRGATAKRGTATAASRAEARDASVAGMVRHRSASDLIALVESLGHPVGTLFNIQLYRSWLQLHGDAAPAAFAIWFNLGTQYAASSDAAASMTCYANAIALRPDFYQAALNLGLAHEAAGDLDRALATWRKALQPDEARTALLNHCGRVLEQGKLLDEAQRDYTASLLTTPNQPDVLHHWLGLRTRTCAWPSHDAALPGVTREAMQAATRALTLLALSDDREEQDRGNASWIAEKHPPAPLHLSRPQGYGHRRLRIGYMSSDFCMHPIAYLVAELFELHDRTAFEIFGYCNTRDDGSAVRERILRSFDRWTDIRAMSDEQAARAIRADEIDILVDLNGLTLGSRLQVLRWRPAPVQMTYLGYVGPVPLPELDYIIADRTVIPEDAAASHRPPPLYLPRCFQSNDATLPVATGETREGAGLPRDKFVFCCFSNTYKITQSLFDAWMAILRRAENSVLWLFVDNPYAQGNIEARAAAAGLAPDRLIFAGRVEPSRYRARLALADLFLDTYPYNAGTTASDALRVGLPLVTLSGATFTSRMAGSLLRTMGLDDGIVADEASYIDLAVALATDPARYTDYRRRTAPDVWRRTLGDTPRFCRELEDAFRRVAPAVVPLLEAV